LYAISKTLDAAVLVMLVAFFVGVLAFDVAHFGLHDPLIPIPHEAEPYFEALPWAILGFLLADIYIKYKKLDGDWRALLRHHWADVAMAVLIPVFMPLKFIKLVKALKAAKSGVRIFQKGKKVFKYAMSVSYTSQCSGYR
jgi:hypothetical protein